MAIKIESLEMWQAVVNLRTALADISPAAGYNTRPTIIWKPLTDDTVPQASYPALYLEMIGFLDETTKFGAFNSFTEDGELAFVLWAYVKEPGDMQESMLALLIDIFETIWSDESRGDNAVLTNIGNVEFTESVLNADNVGVMAIPISLKVQIQRGTG